MTEEHVVEGLNRASDGTSRCWWAGDDDEYRRYHDHEWGRPTVDDRTLFEKVCLEGFQAGLSWLTILRKRENFRRAFDNFEPVKVAEYSESRVLELLDDEGIIRHRGKIEATINNAQRLSELTPEFSSFAAYAWSFEPEPSVRPAELNYSAVSQLSKSPASEALSKDLKRRGWKFVGPTTAYAFMQAMGLVNDHLEGCIARSEIESLREGLLRPV